MIALLCIAGCSSTIPADLTPPIRSRTPEQVQSTPRPSPTSVPTRATRPATRVPLLSTPTKPPVPQTLTPSVSIGRGKIVSAVFLPGAQQIAIAWANGVSLNMVSTGREVWFQQTPSNVIAFDVQAQGRAFAAALSDGSVMTFEATSGKPQRFQRAQPDADYGDIAWSPDGRTLAFQYMVPSKRNDPIYLLDVVGGRIREVPDSQTADGVIPALVWSPDGSSIFISSLGGPLDAPFPRFVDIQTGQERMHLPQSGQVVSSAPIFLTDGQTLASEGPAGTVDLLRFSDGVKVRVLRSGGRLLGRRLTEFPDTGSPLFIDPSGRWIAYRGGYESCYCGSGKIPSQYPMVVWDLARGAVKARLSQVVGALKERHRLAATFDGDSIVMLYESGEITRWAFGDPRAQETALARVPVRPATGLLNWAADGSRLTFTSLYGGVEVYDTTGRLAQRFDPPLTTPALSPDGQSVALFDPDRNLEILYWVQEKQIVATFSATPVLMGAAFSSDGRFLAYGAGDHAAVADLASGRIVSLALTTVISPQAELTFTRLRWSPDGQALAGIVKVGTSDGTDRGLALVWKRHAEGTFVLAYQTVVPQASNESWELVAFSPTGKRVALQVMGDESGAPVGLIVYDLAQGRVIQMPGAYRLGVWLSDEDLLAVEAQYASRLTRIHVTDGQKNVAVSVGAVAHSPDGRFVARTEELPNHTGTNVAIRKWQNGEVVAQIPGETSLVADHPWSPDGRWLATPGRNGTLRLWPVTLNGE